MFKPGSVHRYEICERIGSGGMADVFRADAILAGGTRVPVVLKRIRPQNADDAHFRAMFLDEARITSYLDHPNIAQLLDAGRIDDTVFLAFELVEGVDLRRALEVAGTTPMELSAALYVGTRVLDALDCAHHAADPKGEPLSIVHRDVSSANVLLSWSGEAKLTDFGLARARVREVATTAKGRVKGNLYFLAPEQITQREITARTDIYQAGMLLLRALSGKHPFEGEPLKQVVDRILTGDVPVPSYLNPKVPREIDQLVADALRARPESRYPTAREFALALRHFAEREGIVLDRTRVAVWLQGLFPGAGRAGAAPPRVTRIAEPAPAKSGGGSRFTSRSVDAPDARSVTVVKPMPPPAPPPPAPIARARSKSRILPPANLAGPPVKKEKGLRQATTEAIPVGELKSETPVRRLQGHMGAVNAVAMAADGKRAISGGDDATVRVWRPEGASRVLEGHEGAVTCVATAGSLAVSGSHDGTVRCWDLTKGKAAAALFVSGGPRPDGGSSVLCTAIDESARRVIAGATDGTVRVWSLSEKGAKDEARGLPRLPGPVCAIAFAGSGPAFWSGDAEGAVRTHHADGTSRVFVDGLPTIRALASGGNHLVAACSDHRLRVWRGNSRDPVWTPDDHLGPLTCVAVSADGTLGLSGGEDGVCRLWHLRFQKAVAAFSGHDGPVLGVCFTTNLSWIVSAGADGDLAVWRLTR